MDINAIEKNIDLGMMKNQIFSLPDQIEESFSIIEKYNLDSIKTKFSNVVICGMGGSAISGDFIKLILSDDIDIPIMVIRSYKLPKYVTSNSLVVISSYSGDTEEVVSCYKSALDIGANILCFSTGGKVMELSDMNNNICIRIPKGYQPRAAIGYSLALLLLAFNKLNLCSDSVTDNLYSAVESVRLFISDFDEYSPSIINYAQIIKDSFPIIYGSNSFGYAIAFRFRCQLAENSKILSSCFEFPEQNHNEIEGFVKGMNDKISLVWIYNDMDHPQIIKRMKLVGRILENRVENQIKLNYNYSSLIESLLNATIYTDIISYYVAILGGVNPTPVDVIKVLKSEL